MQKLFYNYIFKSVIIIVTISAFFYLAAIAINAKDQKFEGYQVKFDYQGHPKEREIAYQYYYQKDHQYFSEERPLQKNEIGIDLYDIDNDGEKEILVYVHNSGYCGSGGCSFEILKKSKNSDEKDEYLPILWKDPEKPEKGGIVVDEDIKILSTLNLGVHDLLFVQVAIWRWQGKYYKLVKVMKEN